MGHNTNSDDSTVKKMMMQCNADPEAVQSMAMTEALRQLVDGGGETRQINCPHIVKYKEHWETPVDGGCKKNCPRGASIGAMKQYAINCWRLYFIQKALARLPKVELVESSEGWPLGEMTMVCAGSIEKGPVGHHREYALSELRDKVDGNE